MKRIKLKITNALTKTYLFLSIWKINIKNFLLRYLEHPFYRHKFAILSTVYFLFLILVSLLVANYLPLNNEDNWIGSFSTACGAMLGGVIAIVFSLGILIIQNAAEQLPSGFYKIASGQKLPKIAFWILIIITITFFSLAIISNTSDPELSRIITWLIKNFSIPIIGFSFWLLFLLYDHTFKRINPIDRKDRITKEAINYIKTIGKTLSEQTKLIKMKHQMKEASSEQSNSPQSFQISEVNIQLINLRIEYLFDYHDKLISFNENKMAKSVLSDISNIVIQYIKIYIDNSDGLLLKIPSLGKDSINRFFTPVLEDFLSKAKRYIRSDDSDGISHLIWIQLELLESASKIPYWGDGKYSNPVFEQIRGYLGQIGQFGVRHHHIETLFQMALVYKSVGSIAVEKQYNYELIAIFEKLNNIALAGLQAKAEFIWYTAMESANSMFADLVKSNYYDQNTPLKSFFNCLETMIIMIVTSLRLGVLNYSPALYIKVNLSFNLIPQMLFQLVNQNGETKDKTEIKNKKLIFNAVIEGYRKMLRSLSEKIKTADNFIIEKIAQSISEIGCLLINLSINPLWEEEKSELLNQAKWYLHEPSWFIHYANEINSNNAFDELIEAVTKIGLEATEHKIYEISEEAIDILYNVAVKMLSKEKLPKYEFTEPRIMKQACLIGILSLKLEEKEIISHIKEKIEFFETEYEKKWFVKEPKVKGISSIHKEQLQTEISDLYYNSFKGTYRLGRGLFDRSEDRLISQIRPEDVDNFTEAIWDYKTSEVYHRTSLF